MYYLANAFSLNMVPEGRTPTLQRISLREAKRLLGLLTYGSDGERRLPEGTSVIGHADTARVLGAILGTEVPMNRTSFTLDDGNAVIVAQYRGPRLPEGTTTLPEGSGFEWWVATLDK